MNKRNLSFLYFKSLILFKDPKHQYLLNKNVRIYVYVCAYACMCVFMPSFLECFSRFFDKSLSIFVPFLNIYSKKSSKLIKNIDYTSQILTNNNSSDCCSSTSRDIIYFNIFKTTNKVTPTVS